MNYLDDAIKRVHGKSICSQSWKRLQFLRTKLEFKLYWLNWRNDLKPIITNNYYWSILTNQSIKSSKGMGNVLCSIKKYQYHNWEMRNNRLEKVLKKYNEWTEPRQVWFYCTKVKFPFYVYLKDYHMQNRRMLNFQLKC